MYHTAANLTDLQTHIEHDLAALADWFNANKLSLNINKTHFLIFLSKNIKINVNDMMSLKLGDQTIHRLRSAKFLGIFIDDGLQWDVLINYIAKKIASESYAIN